MKSKEEILTEEEINKSWANANFGDVPRRDVIKEALGKVAQGWSTGHTIMCIMKELGLIDFRNNQNGLSDKGLEYFIVASQFSSSQPCEGREVLPKNEIVPLIASVLYNLKDDNKRSLMDSPKCDEVAFFIYHDILEWLSRTTLPAQEKRPAVTEKEVAELAELEDKLIDAIGASNHEGSMYAFLAWQDKRNDLNENRLTIFEELIKSTSTPIAEEKVSDGEAVEIQPCTAKGCNRPAIGDYNGHGDYACKFHMDKWNDEFDEEYC